MKISIIIPTLNEEKFIGNTITQFLPYTIQNGIDIIVSDNGSSDKTGEIVRRLGVMFIPNKGKRRTIGETRNIGAEHALGNILLFCDADTRIKDVKGLLDEILIIFKDQNIVAAMPRIEIMPDQLVWTDRIYHFIYNNTVCFSFFLGMPFGAGQCQIVRKRTFNEIKGYQIGQVFGEDTTLFRRISRLGKMKFLKNQVVYESPRRFRKHGYIVQAAKGTACHLKRIFFKKDLVNEWDRVD
ncbi:MAG: glycosyltransferase [archaeon]